jgi:hypothetical protein
MLLRFRSILEIQSQRGLVSTQLEMADQLAELLEEAGESIIGTAAFDMIEQHLIEAMQVWELKEHTLKGFDWGQAYRNIDSNV